MSTSPPAAEQMASLVLAWAWDGVFASVEHLGLASSVGVSSARGKRRRSGLRVVGFANRHRGGGFAAIE